MLVIDMIYGCIDAHLGYIEPMLSASDPRDSYYGRRMEGSCPPGDMSDS